MNSPADPDGARQGHGTVLRGLVVLPVLALILGLPSALTGIVVDPSTSASATPDPSASALAEPTAPATPNPPSSPAPSAVPSASPNPAGSSGSVGAGSGASPSPSPSPTGTPPPFAVATAQSTLTAASASITGFRYDGVVSVPTASGSQQMMEFSATSIDLAGARLTVSQGGGTMTTTASSLDFSGNVVLYATQLSGDLLGIPTTLTPGNAVSTILQLLGQLGLTQSLTQGIPLTMTNVTTLQPFTSANAMTANALHIS